MNFSTIKQMEFVCLTFNEQTEHVKNLRKTLINLKNFKISLLEKTEQTKTKDFSIINNAINDISEKITAFESFYTDKIKFNFL